MQLRQHTALLLFIPLQMLFANEYATSDSGKKVILYDNGTWKEFLTELVPDSSSSPCDQWLKTETDKMTGDVIVGIREPIIISDDGMKTGLGISLLRPSNEKGLIFTITASGAGNCIDTGSKINILFRDKTRMELTTDSKFNCEGRATVYFGGIFGRKKELVMLAAKPVETIRVWTSKGFVEKDLTQDQSNALFNSIKCLTSSGI